MHTGDPSKWSGALWIVRHAESAGNLAHDLAERSGDPRIAIPTRDVDVPLSALGERQAEALGRWFGEPPEADCPTALLSSPYRRAFETSRRLLDAAGS